MAAKKKTKTPNAPGKTAPRRSPAKARKKGAPPGVPTVSQFMTRTVQTIGRDQPLSLAHELMNAHRIRHLPVLDGGKLVGLVSQRDLYFVEALDNTSPDRVPVDEAMTQDVFETGPDTPLSDVVRTMLDKKYGCAVVTEGGQVVGVFSAIDALEAFLKFLEN